MERLIGRGTSGASPPTGRLVLLAGLMGNTHPREKPSLSGPDGRARFNSRANTVCSALMCLIDCDRPPCVDLFLSCLLVPSHLFISISFLLKFPVSLYFSSHVVKPSSRKSLATYTHCNVDLKGRVQGERGPIPAGIGREAGST